eukprot:CAMPEP_0202867078 /NCGR_PEP_ID=MMETSP1391-20130828/8645_1 /ASSEMBLY_ACC=CAM_ASM_000867 /TAXON_ID=1034604 /ORGANISM="Chlamydomonas leiostraca, Strain SAG 11-49" /LENGTH=184 /DNA_ID=CAMNT_0049547083 /DNA_START=95 /DNA_END=649 /DNA_ORIENTATION=+
MPGQPPEPHLHGGCDCEVFERLEQVVTSPQFLKTLEMTASQCSRPAGQGTSADRGAPPPAAALQGPWTAGTGRWQMDTSDIEDDFVVVESEEAIESMAYYLAQCIAACPEAQALPPQKLQEALTTTLKSLKQSRFKQVWSMGRHVYRWSALTYSALQMYQNPWLVQAVVGAVWTFSRIGIRLIW